MDTIVAGSMNSNCRAGIASSSFSLSSDGTCGFGPGHDQVTLRLGPLGDNGGFTQTHLPLSGSLAIDNGTGIGCLGTDQGYIARPQGDACDVGAVAYRAGEIVMGLYLPLVIRKQIPIQFFARDMSHASGYT